MMLRYAASALLCLAPLGVAAKAPQVDPRPGMPEFTGGTPMILPAPDPTVRATVLPGTAPVRPGAPVVIAPATGDISLNFPAADVRAVAQAVLGDILKAPFQVAPGIVANVTLVTPTPISRGAVFGVFEEALKASNLAVGQSNGVFYIQTLDAAKAAGALTAPGTSGFGTETIALEFVNADEMKKLLDSIVPGVVTRVEPGQNTLVVAGTSGQRTNVRALLKQFDVNWLRGMSFALFVPQRTDSRLIVPELEKLINGEGAPTRGLVRLIGMERLNGILAITAQRQYIEDVRRWVEILDREGENNEQRLFVYRVQNGRSKDLVKVLNTAFGRSGGTGDSSALSDPFALSGADRNGSAAARSGTADYRTQPDASGALANPRAPLVLPGNPAAAGIGPGGTAVSSNGSSPITATISSDETNNAIVVFGTSRDYAVIEDALRKLDILPQQVLIEAAITEVSLNDALRYGVQWNFQSGDSNVSLVEGATSAVTRTFPGFSYFFSGNSISATLNALEQRTKINVISAPKLLVLNNQTAALQVGDQVPVATQSAVGVVNPDSPIVNSIEYRDTGVILKITPRVNAGGLVLLDVAQEVSAVSTATATTSAENNSPTISTRRISTSIAVQDGQVIALGGLISSTRSKGSTGIPVLSRIPVLGALFGRKNDTENRNELLILLRPRVLRTIDDASAVTDELRSKIRTVEPIRTGKLP